jgi:hypothetical protein
VALKPYQPTINAGQTSEDKFRLGDYVGTLVAFQVIDYKETATTKYGDKPEVTADVTIIDGTDEGKEFAAAKLWAASLVRDLSTSVGETVVARIGEWRNATNSGYELHAPTADDMNKAETVIPNF